MNGAGFAAGIVAAVSIVSVPALAGPSSSFEGAYVGVNAGAAWGTADYATDPGCPTSPQSGAFCVLNSSAEVNGPPVANAGTGELSSTGFTGGIQGGYSWQFGNIVIGGEGDFGILDLGRSTSVSGTFPPTSFLGDTFTLTQSMSTDWLATLRGRLGLVVAPQLLLYATGGLALTEFKFSSSYSDNAIGGIFPGGTGFGSKSGVRTGWTVGGGGEWLFPDGWSVKAEYLYVDFGSESIAVPVSNTPGFQQTMRVDADLSASIARVGLNHRF
jgi:outer membrane immunogenic protein